MSFEPSAHLEHHSTPEELLDFFLRASDSERAKHFADTARAAQLTGLSRRTIQLWISLGQIQAIPIGKRYQIYVPSLVSTLRRYLNAATDS